MNHEGPEVREEYGKRLMFVLALFAGLIGCVAAFAAEPALRPYESKYYVIHTDLPDVDAREAQARMTRMAEEYRNRTAEFSGQIKSRLPFYLYKDLQGYRAAGGAEKSGGYFDGEKLMAVTLRRGDGLIDPATWHIVQHEGFHQFAHAVIGGEIPMWADEGLAEYFGEGLFTGDGFVTGLIPQARLVRVRAALRDHQYRPLREFVAITREQWNARIEMKDYDQAWSLVHFFAHGDEGRLQKPFNTFMREVGGGGDADQAFNRYLKPIPRLEERWRDWWLALPDDPTTEGYARATLATLTSFLARAHARGQAFAGFDALIKTPADQIRQQEDDWLPPSLFTRAIEEAKGAEFVLVKSADRPPSIVATLKDGTRLAGRFAIKDGHPESVRVEVLVKGRAAPADAARKRSG
jgi:hypothetical protein